MTSFQPPRWAKPDPLGYGAAVDAAHFVAAPLLAASCVAVIGVLAADGDKFRLPGPALLALALALISLIGSVQYGFHARSLLYSSADLESWWGAEDLLRFAEQARERQRAHFELWRSKITRAVRCYNAGISFLGGGVAVSLVPQAGADSFDAVFRWIAFSVVALVTLAETTWLFVQSRVPLSCAGTRGTPTRS